MEKIRTEVTLTNAIDQVLERRGERCSENVLRCRVAATVDPYSAQNLLPASIVEVLGLGIMGRRTVEVFGGRVALPVTDAVVIEIDCRSTIEDALVYGSEVTIGMTVLQSLDLRVDDINHRVVPNPAHPDGQTIKIKIAA